jgi:hypothetical protein
VSGKLQSLSLITSTVLVLALTACSPTLPTQGIPTQVLESATITVTSTPTIIWFPATPTATQLISPSPVPPTQAPPPSVGDLIFQDNFTNHNLWTSGKLTVGIIAYGIEELDLAISEPHGVLISQRSEPVLTDFYLEVTAEPSLCLNGDNYGIQFRMSSPGDFYRYIISCQGKIRLERLKGGVGQVLLDWSNSAQAMPNPSGTYRLGIWAKGKELKLYLNGMLQFSATDDSLASGGLALFARSMGDNPVTVGFSNLVVSQPG